MDFDEEPTGPQPANARAWRLLYSACDLVPDAELEKFCTAVHRLAALGAEERAAVWWMVALLSRRT